MAESHPLDALRRALDLTVASQIIPPRKGILRLRRDYTAKILGGSGLRPRRERFGKDTDGSWLWPGYAENSRVLKWIVERLDGQAAAMPSAIGNLPTRESFDVSGMDLDHRRRQRPLTIDRPRRMAYEAVSSR